ncbi:MAG: hypothetical protein WKF71_17735 [Pyrinomonadaceae bacterium]
MDEDVIKNQIFPDLVKKYFSDSESANYKLAVTKLEDAKIIFQTQNENLEASDAAAKLFAVLPENINFFVNKQVGSSVGEKNKRTMLLSSEIQKLNQSESILQTETSRQAIKR